MQILSNPISALNVRESPKFLRISRKYGLRNTIVTSDFRAEVEIRPFCACVMHPSIIIETVRSLWTWLWCRYHVPQNVLLIYAKTTAIFTHSCCSDVFTTAVVETSLEMSSLRIAVVWGCVGTVNVSFQFDRWAYSRTVSEQICCGEGGGAMWGPVEHRFTAHDIN